MRIPIITALKAAKETPEDALHHSEVIRLMARPGFNGTYADASYQVKDEHEAWKSHNKRNPKL